MNHNLWDSIKIILENKYMQVHIFVTSEYITFFYLILLLGHTWFTPGSAFREAPGGV